LKYWHAFLHSFLSLHALCDKARRQIHQRQGEEHTSPSAIPKFFQTLQICFNDENICNYAYHTCGQSRCVQRVQMNTSRSETSSGRALVEIPEICQFQSSYSVDLGIIMLHGIKENAFLVNAKDIGQAEYFCGSAVENMTEAW
jgi:hypothetical protein